MGSRQRPQLMNRHRIQDYVRDKNALTNTPYVIKTDGTGWFLSGGKEYAEAEYLRAHRPVLLPLARENFDRTNNWMQDKKSY